MKIEAITLREIQMPLVHFFETSFGRTYSRRILLVTVHCDGVDGWAESVVGEDPFYSSEWIDGAWPTLTSYLIPMLLGKEIKSARECPALLAKVRVASHGESGSRKRALGGRSHAETDPALEIAWRKAPPKFLAAYPLAFKTRWSSCLRR